MVSIQKRLSVTGVVYTVVPATCSHTSSFSCVLSSPHRLFWRFIFIYTVTCIWCSDESKSLQWPETVSASLTPHWPDLLIFCPQNNAIHLCYGATFPSKAPHLCLPLDNQVTCLWLFHNCTSDTMDLSDFSTTLHHIASASSLKKQQAPVNWLLIKTWTLTAAESEGWEPWFRRSQNSCPGLSTGKTTIRCMETCNTKCAMVNMSVGEQIYFYKWRAKINNLAWRNSGGGLHIKSDGWGQVLTILLRKAQMEEDTWQRNGHWVLAWRVKRQIITD